MARILIVEDEASLLRVLLTYLTEIEQHEAVGVSTADDARDAAQLGPWDMVVTDRMLPEGEDGERLRSAFPGTRFLTMTGVDQWEADVRKPFSLEEIGAVIRARLAVAP
jgi:DNA-binding response OmpR family regulator